MKKLGRVPVVFTHILKPEIFLVDTEANLRPTGELLC
jgi:hypothetical protein